MYGQFSLDKTLTFQAGATVPYLQPSAFALNAIKHPFSQLVKDRGTFGPWKAVNYVSHLRPGDILVNNAHVMIVMEKPKELGDKGSR